MSRVGHGHPGAFTTLQRHWQRCLHQGPEHCGSRMSQTGLGKGCPGNVPLSSGALLLCCFQSPRAWSCFLNDLVPSGRAAGLGDSCWGSFIQTPRPSMGLPLYPTCPHTVQTLQKGQQVSSQPVGRHRDSSQQRTALCRATQA